MAITSSFTSQFPHDLEEALQALPRRDKDIFELRLERHLPDLYEAYMALYGQRKDVISQLQRLVLTLARHYQQRSEHLKLLDIQRSLSPDWFQHETMLGYVFYVERFNQTISGIQEKTDYLKELGVSYVHLMKVIKAREGENDGGFAVADYRDVDPDLGSVADLEKLCDSLRQEGISVCIDLVLNHCADEHEWVKRARNNEEAFQDYFYIYPDREMPDRYEQSLPEVFPDFAPGNFTFDEDMGKWVWTTFNRYQWDLNYRNPQVLLEIIEIICFWANKGVEVFRLDAVAFMWKRLGTDSQNQPEVFEILQVLQMCSRIVSPAVIHKAEAIVPPQHLIRYLGQGKHSNKVSQLAYHNSLMVHYWSALASRDTRLMTYVLEKFPHNPASTSWATYLRCHDDIGWAINDDDAGRLGMNGLAHRAFLSDYYSGTYAGSHAIGEVFQFNPDTGDRRISGSLASLNGLEKAHKEQDTLLLEMALRRIHLGYALILSFGGLPLFYMGDEIGLFNDYNFEAEPDKASDNRWVHRPPMDWHRAEKRFEESFEKHLFSGIQHLVRVRQSQPQFHAGCHTGIVNLNHPGLFCLVRHHPLGSLLAIFNMTDSHQQADLRHSSYSHFTQAIDVLSMKSPHQQDAKLSLAPYQALWLRESEAI